MENVENKLVGILILGVLLFAGAGAGTLVTLSLTTGHDQVAFGGPADQVTLDNTSAFGTADMITAGPLADTLLVATNTGRVYLEVSNIATTGSQVLYCNTNDRPVTIGKGMTVQASSTRIFTNLIGAIRCKYAAASSGVAYFEK